MHSASELAKKGVEKKSDLENMVPFGHFFRQLRSTVHFLGQKKWFFRVFYVVWLAIKKVVKVGGFLDLWVLGSGFWVLGSGFWVLGSWIRCLDSIVLIRLS